MVIRNRDFLQAAHHINTPVTPYDVLSSLTCIVGIIYHNNKSKPNQNKVFTSSSSLPKIKLTL
jgi:hypothetical protein